MNIDELFIKSESGRSSSLLASLADEELSERPDFDSIDDWKKFYKEKENYKMIIGFLFQKYMNISNLNDSIYKFRYLTDNIFDAYCLRYSFELGAERVINDETFFVNRFVDFGNNTMNYIKFVFWMTHFFYRQNLLNKKLIDKEPYNNYRLLFSTNSGEWFSCVEVKYSEKLLKKSKYESLLILSIVKDLIEQHYKFSEEGFINLSVSTLMRWVNYMRLQFGLNDAAIFEATSLIRSLDRLYNKPK